MQYQCQQNHFRQTQSTPNIQPFKSNSTCKTIKPCSYQEYGCKYTGPICKLPKHEEAASKAHIGLLKNIVLKYNDYICCMNEEIKRINENIKEEEKEIPKLEKEISQQREQLQNLRKSELQLRTEMNEVEARDKNWHDKLLKTMSFMLKTQESKDTGHFYWTLHFERALASAQEDANSRAVATSNFYSHFNGYKMRAVVYPNGLGEEEGSYLSVLIQIQKGDNDEYLKWPFSRKIVITLLNLNPNARLKENIKKIIVPDPELDSFQRPCEEDNPAFGIPDFISHKSIYLMFDKPEDNNLQLDFHFRICPDECPQ